MTEKKPTSARRTVNAIALTMIFSVILSYLLSYLHYYLAPILENAAVSAVFGISGMSRTEALIFVQDAVSSEMWHSLIYMISTFITLFLPFHFLSKRFFCQDFDDAMNFSGKVYRYFLIAFALMQMMGVVGVTVSNAISSVLIPNFAEIAEEIAEAESAYISSPGDAVVYFLSTCIFTPFVEEYVFRGVIYKNLRRYGIGFSIVSSAIMFGLAHGSVSGFVYAFSSGIVLALVYEKTGNIKTSVLLHSMNNFIIFIFDTLLPSFLGEYEIFIINIAFDALIGVYALIGLVIFIKKVKKSSTTSFEDSEQKPERTSSLGTLFGSVPFIIYALLFVYNQVTYFLL